MSRREMRKCLVFLFRSRRRTLSLLFLHLTNKKQICRRDCVKCRVLFCSLRMSDPAIAFLAPNDTKNKLRRESRQAGVASPAAPRHLPPPLPPRHHNSNKINKGRSRNKSGVSIRPPPHCRHPRRLRPAYQLPSPPLL